MRIWWALLMLTGSFFLVMLATPPSTEHFPCDEAAAMILVSPGYSDGEVNPDGPDLCAPAARDQALFAFVPFAVVITGTTIAHRRRARARTEAHAGARVPAPAGGVEP